MDEQEFLQQMANAEPISIKDQLKAGAPIAGAMNDPEKDFLHKLIKMIDDGDIDSDNPESLLNPDVYEGLDQEWKDETDLAVANLADQIRLIEDFYRSTETPDECPQLETMVLQLWQIKERIEEHHDVFKF